MGKVKLYVVIGGHNYWRLRTDREAAQYLREFPLPDDVVVNLSNSISISLIGRMKTYKYLSLTHPAINRWIKTQNLNRKKEELPLPLQFIFNIDVETNTHIYTYVRKLRSKANNTSQT